jgi:hypothetical protein
MRVAVEPPVVEEAYAILAHSFPVLEALLPRAVAMLMLMRRVSGQAEPSEAGYNVRPHPRLHKLRMLSVSHSLIITLDALVGAECGCGGCFGWQWAAGGCCGGWRV